MNDRTYITPVFVVIVILALVALLATCEQKTPQPTFSPLAAQAFTSPLYLPYIEKASYYTQTALVVSPDFVQAGIGEVVTVTLLAMALTRTSAIELKLFNNPTVTPKAWVIGRLPCDRFMSRRVEPGALRYECETTVPLFGDIALFDVALRCAVTGTSYIEPAGSFVGYESGAGVVPGKKKGIVKCQ